GGDVALWIIETRCSYELLWVKDERQQWHDALQHRWFVVKVLGDSQPLQLTAGYGSRRSMGVVGGADGGEQLVDLLLPPPREQPRPPLVSVDAHPHEVAAAHRCVRVDPALLGDVADGRVARMHSLPGHLGGAGRQGVLPEQHL